MKNNKLKNLIYISLILSLPFTLTVCGTSERHQSDQVCFFNCDANASGSGNSGTGNNGGTDPNTGADLNQKPSVQAINLLQTGQVLNTEVQLTIDGVNLSFVGESASIILDEDGSFTGYFETLGSQQNYTISGIISGNNIYIGNVRVSSSLGSGIVSNLELTVNSSGTSAVGTFDFVITKSPRAPEKVGDTISGTVSMKRRAAVTPIDFEDFLDKTTTYDVTIYLSGFKVAAEAKITTLNFTTGAISSSFDSTLVDNPIKLDGNMKGEEISFEGFSLNNETASGVVSKIEAFYDQDTNRMIGTFDFLLTNSATDQLVNFIGETFEGYFVIER